MGKVRSAWDIWIYLAGEKRRQEASEGTAQTAPSEEVDDQIRTQQAEGIAMLRRT